MTNVMEQFKRLENPASVIRLYFCELHLSADYNPEFESQGHLIMRCQGMAEIDEHVPAGENYLRRGKALVCPLDFSVNDCWPTFPISDRCLGVGVVEGHKMSIDLKMPSETLKLFTELMTERHEFTSRDPMIERFVNDHPNLTAPKYFLRVNFELSKKQDPEERVILFDIEYLCTDP